MDYFLTFLEQSGKSRSREELIKSLDEALLHIGVDRFIYSLVRRRFMPNDKIIHGVERSYPEDWMKHYIANNYVKNDPTYQRIIEGKGIFTWKSLQDTQQLSDKGKQVLLEAEDAGLKIGVSLSIHGPQGEVRGIGFASSLRDEQFSDTELNILYAIGNQFHLMLSNFEAPAEASLPVTLTGRQKEILQWAALGKSKSVIAGIMGLSENTVDSHFRGIFEKLDCHDRTIAILKAIQLGLIQV